MKLYSITLAGFVLAAMYYGAAGTIISFQNDKTSTAHSECRLIPQQVSYARSQGWVSRDAARFYGTSSSIVIRLFYDDSDLERVKRRAYDCQEIYEDYVKIYEAQFTPDPASKALMEVWREN